MDDVVKRLLKDAFEELEQRSLDGKVSKGDMQDVFADLIDDYRSKFDETSARVTDNPRELRILRSMFDETLLNLELAIEETLGLTDEH